MLLTDNIREIRSDIAACGRQITVVAAVKTQTSDTVDELMRVAPDFILGENRVQELTAKYNPAYRWQFIGQLQCNKVKYIADKVELIHSLDRDDLAREIEKQAAKIGKVQPCLIEVNMGAEITKGGVEPSAVCSFIRSLKDYEHIKVEGIMSVLPNLDDIDRLDGMYAELKELYGEVKQISQQNVEVKYLSAGMSHDYKIALRHGANIIRLGRILFGERVYTVVND